MNQNFSTIIDEIKSTAEQEPSVHAMWIAGSVAEGYADEYSDIDLWLDIDDGQDEAIYSLIEDVLTAESELDINFTEDMSPPFTHKVYRLKDADPYHFMKSHFTHTLISMRS